MTSIVSNILLSPFFPFLLLFLPFSLSPCASLVPRIQSMHIRLLGFSSWLSNPRRPPGMHMHAQTANARPNLAPFLTFAGCFDAHQVNPVDRCAWGRGSYSLSSATCPLSPGAPSRVWNVEVKTKVPDRYQTSRGGGVSHSVHPKNPHPQATRQSQSWIGPVSTACGRRRPTHHPLHTFSAFVHSICTSLHLSGPPLGSERGRPGVTPNPRAPIIPTLLVIPRFSHLLLLLLLLLLSSSACYYCPLRTLLPCPPFAASVSLTASPPRLASPSITCVNRPPGQPAHSSPPPQSRHHWNAQ